MWGGVSFGGALVFMSHCVFHGLGFGGGFWVRGRKGLEPGGVGRLMIHWRYEFGRGAGFGSLRCCLGYNQQTYIECLEAPAKEICGSV